jgi:hypothetical protein
MPLPPSSQLNSVAARIPNRDANPEPGSKLPPKRRSRVRFAWKRMVGDHSFLRNSVNARFAENNDNSTNRSRNSDTFVKEGNPHVRGNDLLEWEKPKIRSLSNDSRQRIDILTRF